MGRARQNFTGRLRLAPAAVVGIALALVGCSAGQISQTASMEPAINGGIGQVGTIAIRNVQLAYPPEGVYPAESSALLLGTFVNIGQTDDELISATTPAGPIAIEGDRSLPAGRTLVSDLENVKAALSSAAAATTTTTPPATSSSSPQTSGSQSPTSPTAPTSGNVVTTTPPPTTTTSASPASIGKVILVVTALKEEIRSGKTIEVTFTFRSGQAIVVVPIAVPTNPRTAHATTEGH